ncbi:MAG: ATP-binding protein [Gemmatimonadaceae bacterium]
MSGTELIHAQKMEVLGQLAGGIAHDFNNILTVITACSGMVLSSLSPDDEKFGDVTEIEGAARRAAGPTRQLLGYCRNQPVNKKPLDLNPIIVETQQMLSRVLSAKVTIEARLAPELWLAHADTTQLQQVVLNLAVNARDAMPDGGTLLFSSTNARVTAERLPDGGSLPPGKYVRIGVRDTGSGIAEDVVARIFEPFFATKAAGAGTGLGLATVQAIVTDLQGYITIDTAAGEGTEFGIYLPRSPALSDAA